MIGGRSVDRVEAAIWALSGGERSQLSDLPNPTVGPTARIMDGRLVVAGGAPSGLEPQPALWAQTMNR